MLLTPFPSISSRESWQKPRAKKEGRSMMAFSRLPEDVIAQIISLTTPRDACAMSSVCTHFRSIAGSDRVWANFLLPGCVNPIPQISTKKSLFRRLCCRSVLVDGRNISFTLDKKNGKTRFMIGARELILAWGNDRHHCIYIDAPNFRFGKVAQLICVCWFQIIGRIETRMLSPKTRYAAYLIFQFRFFKSGFHRPVASCVWVEGDGRGAWMSVVLDPWEREPRLAGEGGDGWPEVEMGEFYNENGDDGTLVGSLKQADAYIVARDLNVEGI